MIAWLAIWIMQILAANNITMATYVELNYLVVIISLFKQSQTSLFVNHQSDVHDVLLA